MTQAGMHEGTVDGAVGAGPAAQPGPERPAPGWPGGVGRGALGALRAIGRACATGYRAVDPAARRHLLELPLLGLSFLASRHGRPRALPDDGRRPIVLVHGLGGHRGNFAPMRAWLRLFGHARTYAIGYGDTRCIEQMAAHLAACVREVQEVNGLPPTARVDLVAHSMGGLVARVALEDPDLARRIGTLVTLGTPHGGTLAARFGGTPHLRQLRPGSPLMSRLGAQLPWAAPLPRLVCVWSSDDVLVLPAEAAHLAGAEAHELSGMTHLGYLLHPRSFQTVVDLLAPRPIAALGSGEAVAPPASPA